MITFAVRGVPMSQGNKTAFAVRRKGGDGAWEYTGKTTMREGRSDKAKERFTTWRLAVKEAAMDAMLEATAELPCDSTDPFPMDGPLVAVMVFTLKRPDNHFLPVNSRRSVPELRADAPPRPAGKPDLGKLARAVEDAITQAGLWRDDSRVVEYRRLAKVYPDSGNGSLPFPGVVVTIVPLPMIQWLPNPPLQDDERPTLL